MECPVCEYPDAQVRYRISDRFFGAASGRFVLYHCDHCGLLFQPESVIPADSAQFYPAGYWWKDAGGIASLERRYREWMVRHDQLRFLLRLIPEPHRLRLLDIGCGEGLFVRLAHEAGFDAYGLETAAEAVELGRQHLPGRVLQGTARDLLRQGQQFDVITMFHVLEHMAGPLAYLRSLQRLLRAPGRIVIQVPNANSLQARVFGARWYGLDCPRHVFNYTAFALAYLLGRVGFRIRKVRYFSLRDNAAALVSSLFPRLDPTSQRVRLLRRRGRGCSAGLTMKELLYFKLLVLTQPLAFTESLLGLGATVTIYATAE